ncbi:hypothetical protein CRUP_035269 [Coryphaenoides rupestris]|nr:hypothetical protein CRUP_035269 [Coryphaenoides rupestris]
MSRTHVTTASFMFHLSGEERRREGRRGEERRGEERRGEEGRRRGWASRELGGANRELGGANRELGRHREVRLIVASQRTSQEALRLEVLLQPPPKKKLPADCLDRAQGGMTLCRGDDSRLTRVLMRRSWSSLA